MANDHSIFVFHRDWCANTALVIQCQILVEKRLQEGHSIIEQLRAAEELRDGLNRETIAWYWANCLVITIKAERDTMQFEGAHLWTGVATNFRTPVDKAAGGTQPQAIIATYTLTTHSDITARTQETCSPVQMAVERAPQE
ncbi:hypothetical protein JX265_013436 [Neoarthrinium moseri]|uniref:Uncharacterized protein n=1 Tax=Neoarthrinium moseri TaxID=1658444 RepID=A0A9P9W8Q8_9PEZI|nr:hypothetical protein JX266_009826 [Neoarthrinium moseri]KAI1850474.1 hypothetical protein JX265_013436 [Neoarthrinium moseri]